MSGSVRCTRCRTSAPSALADGPRRAPRLAVAAAVSGLVCSLTLVGCSDNTSITPPTAATDSSDAREAAAQQTLGALETAFRSGDAAAAEALAVPDLSDRLDAAVANIGRLDLVDLSVRYVADVAATTVAGTADGPQTWQATVAISYRLDGWDTGATEVETTFTFAPDGGATKIAEIGSADGRTPLWLAGPVTRVAAGRTLVLTRDGSGARASALAQQAVADVDKVLPRWRGRLVIEEGADEQEFDRALGATRAQYANIAAVTASVDGSLDPGSPVHVFLNPAVFDTIGRRGAQVVISHESTHVATGATFAEMPTWLLEGFADYVALAHSGIGVKTAAAQILKRIRADGLPDSLPTNDDLSPVAGGLGATYEEAWLANRFLAREYGETKLIAFYDAVNGGTKAADAFGSVLGTTEAAFVQAWRADLRTLAR